MMITKFGSIAAKGAAAVALTAACVGGVAVADAQAQAYVTGVTGSSIDVRWDANSSASAYYVNVSDADTSQYKRVGQTSGTSYRLTGLSPNKKYDIEISYPCAYGEGYVAAEYGCATVPSQIKNIKLTSSLIYTKKGMFSWDARTTADGYQVEYKSAKGKKKAYDQGSYSSSSTYVSLDPKQFYSVKVRSYVKLTSGAKVYSAWSPTKYVNIQQKLKAKLIGSSKAKISWSKVKGAKNYTVYGSFKQKSGYKKLKTTKGKTFTVTKIGKKKIKKHKRFYIYVTASKKVGKTTYRTRIDNTFGYYIY